MILFHFKPFNTLKSDIYGYKLSAQQTFYLNTRDKTLLFS